MDWIGPLFWTWWLGMAMAVAIIAGRRNRCGVVWLILGLLFNVLALGVLLWLPPKKVDQSSNIGEANSGRLPRQP